MNIIDQNALLTSEQKALLRENANKTYSFGDFISLDDIVRRLKVGVIIEPGTPIRSVDEYDEYYEKATKYWRNVYERLYKKIQEDDSLRAECQKIEVKLWKLKVEREAHSSMRLLGLYDSQKNVIKLFPEAMAKADASKIDEYLVSTFAHEVMHAYFNRPGHEKYPYAMFVEEPLAEFGMLLYLHEINSPYYEWTYNIVSDKNCCYGYGANIMDQYSGGDTSLKTYLEEYKIPIVEYQLPDFSNGLIAMPEEGDFVDVEDQPFVAKWTPVYDIPPTYFWDDATKTLGLDGNWRSRHDLSGLVRILLHYRLNSDIEHLYIGKDYICDRFCRDLELDIPTIVSPKHKELTSINGILVLINDNTPVIKSCGRGYYRLKRNGKYSIIDAQLKNVTSFKYDSICHFEKNNLCKVRIKQPDGLKYGYINAKGKEQVAVKYDEIESFENGLAVAKLDGFYGIINEQDEVVVPFNLDYPYMGGLFNGYASIRGYNNKWGTINAQGQVVIPCEYDSQIVFDKDGFDRVRKDGEEFIIDVFGNRKS